MLELVELADEIGGRAAGDARHICRAAQGPPVAAGAGDGLAAAGCGERFAFLHATRRDIGDKACVSVAILELLEPLGHLDDALAGRLELAPVAARQMTAGV